MFPKANTSPVLRLNEKGNKKATRRWLESDYRAGLVCVFALWFGPL
jgi:hypothetical protein